MNYIVAPFSFVDNELRDRWLLKFDEIVKDICKRYNEYELQRMIQLDISDKQVGIVSVGVHIVGSNREKAVNEILRAYEETWD